MAVFLAASCFNKISVLLFYRRMVQRTYGKVYKIAVWAALIFVVVYTIAFEIYMWTICKPVTALWMRYDFTWTEKYHCLSAETESWTAELVGALSCFSDFYAVLLPGLLLLNLKMPKKQKFALYGVFALSFTYVAAAPSLLALLTGNIVVS